MYNKIQREMIVVLLLFHTMNNSALSEREIHEKDCKGLRVGFYRKTCPKAEKLVKKVVEKAVRKAPAMAPSLIRLIFHDCIIEGCDASILLEHTMSKEPTEKTSRGSYGVRGYNIIDDAKKELEKECPKTVSCADIINLAARDAVVLSGLEHYEVETGRRDATVSLESNIPKQLPFPNATLEHMEELFNKKGLNYKDLVVLLGSHSIGEAHCSIISQTYFNAIQDVDPHADENYAKYLKSKCGPYPGPLPQPPSEKDKVVRLSETKGTKLTAAYYGNLLRGIDPVRADLAILGDTKTKDLVSYYASRTGEWDKKFIQAMIKLGTLQVLTGHEGEIRRHCRYVNKLKKQN